MLLCELSRGGVLLSDSVFLCESFLENGRGLLWRPALVESKQEALVLYGCSSIHMMFMRYPLDVFFMNKQCVVQKIVRNVKPWRFAASNAAYYAMEVNAGATWASDIQIGDELSLTVQQNLLPSCM